MTAVGRRLLVAAVIALLAGAAAVVVNGASPAGARIADAEAFQRLVGGLGLGPAIDPSRCVPEFDPRLQRGCSLRHDPVPGGCAFCPAHADAGRER